MNCIYMMRSCLVVLLFLHVYECSRILAILPCPSPSHGMWNRALVETLASRGHDVTVITPDPGESSEKLHYMSVREETYTSLAVTNTSFINMAHSTWYDNVISHCDYFVYVCGKQLGSTVVQQLLQSKQKFDLVIFEAFGSECFLSVLPKLGAPVVGVSAFGCAHWGCKAMGAYLPSSVYPDFNLSFSTNMTIYERLVNFVVSWIMQLVIHHYFIPAHERVARQVLGEDVPHLTSNFSMLLVNEGPPGLDLSKAYPPSIIPVGCIQCRTGKPLKQDLEEFLSGATHGAILFSLGTNAKCGEMTPDKMNILLEVFSVLPQRVLWKCDLETLPGLTKNVKLAKWLPQQDVLGHKNVRLFISHGGRLSSQEAKYHGVPILSLPLYGDQFLNSRLIEEQGVGLQLDFHHITKQKLLTFVQTLLYDDRYKERSVEISGIIHDQPESPLDRAAFWTEYVIRHKGAPHLRSPVTLVPWYQIYFLDLILVALLISFLIYTSLGKLLRRFNTTSFSTKKNA